VHDIVNDELHLEP